MDGAAAVQVVDQIGHKTRPLDLVRPLVARGDPHQVTAVRARHPQVLVLLAIAGRRERANGHLAAVGRDGDLLGQKLSRLLHAQVNILPVDVIIRRRTRHRRLLQRQHEHALFVAAPFADEGQLFTLEAPGHARVVGGKARDIPRRAACRTGSGNSRAGGCYRGRRGAGVSRDDI